jgi:hypothetical protein
VIVATGTILPVVYRHICSGRLGDLKIEDVGVAGAMPALVIPVLPGDEAASF